MIIMTMVQIDSKHTRDDDDDDYGKNRDPIESNNVVRR